LLCVSHVLWQTSDVLGHQRLDTSTNTTVYPVTPTKPTAGLLESRQIAVGWKPTNPLKDGYAEIKDDYFPGDLGFDPLNLSPKDDEAFLAMRLRELNNGR
jgi:Chlorophyll A-B binding protein